MTINSVTISASITGKATAPADLANIVANAGLAAALSFTDGAAASQVQAIFADTRSINASSNESLDLNGGGLLDVLGAAFNLTKLKAIMVKAAGNNPENVVVSRPASNGVPFLDAAGDSHSIAPGGVMLLARPDAAGWTVTADTGDLIGIANGGSGGAVSYSILLIGATS